MLYISNIGRWYRVAVIKDRVALGIVSYCIMQECHVQ